MSNFEDVIQSFVPLVFFLPLLIDSGGNAGSQSATLMIRYLAVGGVKLNDWHKLVEKEFIVSFLLGLTMTVGNSQFQGSANNSRCWSINDRNCHDW